MKLSNSILAAIASPLILTPLSFAYAENVTGNQLHSACESTNPTERAFCTGYIIGAFEGSKWGAALAALTMVGPTETEVVNRSSDVLLGYCADTGVTYLQYVDIVKKYLEENPAQRHHSARTLAHDAWKRAFPCNAISFDDLIPQNP